MLQLAHFLTGKQPYGGFSWSHVCLAAISAWQRCGQRTGALRLSLCPRTGGPGPATDPLSFSPLLPRELLTMGWEFCGCLRREGRHSVCLEEAGREVGAGQGGGRGMLPCLLQRSRGALPGDRDVAVWPEARRAPGAELPPLLPVPCSPQSAPTWLLTPPPSKTQLRVTASGQPSLVTNSAHG